MNVVGLDLSLTATGIAVIGFPGLVGDRGTKTAISCVSVGARGSSDDTVADTAIRIRRLAVNIVETIADLAPNVTHVGVESVPPSARNAPGRHSERCGLYWTVVVELVGRGIPVSTCAPKSLKKFATGDGNAPKRLMLDTARALFPDTPIRDDNQADAAFLALAVAQRLGWIDETEPHHRNPAFVWHTKRWAG